MSSGYFDQDFSGMAREDENWAMALSFLYLAFTRILQLVRLGWRDGDELAIEIVWVPRTSSGGGEQDFRGMGRDNEAGPWPSRSHA